jgi:hypothetical protein
MAWRLLVKLTVSGRYIFGKSAHSGLFGECVDNQVI